MDSAVRPPFSDEAFAAIRHHPDFRAAVDSFAAETSRHDRSLSPDGRWIRSDLGRLALAGAAIILDAMPDDLTAQRLLEAARANRTCSRGRAMAFLDRLQGMGLLAIQPGEAHWTRRRIELKPELCSVFTEQARIYLRTLAILDPAFRGRDRRLDDPDLVRRNLMAIGYLTASRPDLFTGPGRPMLLFLTSQGSMRIFNDLVTRQPRQRSRLLEAAPYSRSSLARLNKVSRIQVTRLLANGEARGLLRDRGGTLEFSQAMSDDAERHFALIFELARVAAEVAGI